MLKKLVFLFLISFVFCARTYAQDAFKGGVSFDFEIFENKEVKEVKESLPSIEKDFIDLNYSINFKPINLLSSEDFKTKKYGTRPKFSVPKTTPDNYEVSLSTGKAKGYMNSSNQIETMIRNNPNDTSLLFAYAIQLKNENRLKEALETADRLVDVDPDLALSHFLRGDILRRLERFKEAAEEYVYTAQINPYCADAYYNIGKILELLDDNELALDYYKTAYQINPNDLEIRDIILKHYIEL